MITVFFDGKCGLCSKEIDYYRKIAPQNVFNWEDITETQEELEKSNIMLVDGLRILHARDADGRIHKGVAAFTLIWKQLKYWRILAFLVSLPLVYQVTSFAYKKFAFWRFERLDHCKIALKDNN